MNEEGWEFHEEEVMENGGECWFRDVQEMVNEALVEGGCQFGNVQVRVKEGVWEFVVR